MTALGTCWAKPDLYGLLEVVLGLCLVPCYLTRQTWTPILLMTSKLLFFTKWVSATGSCLSLLHRHIYLTFSSLALFTKGHVLGLVGTLGDCEGACDRNNLVPFPYQCTKANNEYAALRPGAGTLLLENEGGSGTACAHWEEDSFNVGGTSELMTGYFEAFRRQPITRVTVAALDDIGTYTVNYAAADSYSEARRLSDSEGPFKVLSTKTSFYLPDLTEDIVPQEAIPINRKNLRS